MKQPRPYPLYPELDPTEDGFGVYLMEEEGVPYEELERRGRVMRAAPRLFSALKRITDLGERTWEKPVGSQTAKALRDAYEAMDIAENGTKEDRKFEQAGDTQILILPPGETE